MERWRTSNDDEQLDAPKLRSADIPKWRWADVSSESAETLWRGEPSLGYVALGAWGFTAPLDGCAEPVRLVERRGIVDGVQTRNLLAPDLGRALILFTPDAGQEFGEIWQGEGLTHDLAAAALC